MTTITLPPDLEGRLADPATATVIGEQHSVLHERAPLIVRGLSKTSGKPVSPSAHKMRMSCTPRFLSSVRIDSQNFAPSVCWIHIPSTSLPPSTPTPTATTTPLRSRAT